MPARTGRDVPSAHAAVDGAPNARIEAAEDAAKPSLVASLVGTNSLIIRQLEWPVDEFRDELSMDFD